MGVSRYYPHRILKVHSGRYRRGIPLDFPFPLRERAPDDPVNVCPRIVFFTVVTDHSRSRNVDGQTLALIALRRANSCIALSGSFTYHVRALSFVEVVV